MLLPRSHEPDLAVLVLADDDDVARASACVVIEDAWVHTQKVVCAWLVVRGWGWLARWRAVEQRLVGVAKAP